MVVTPFKPVVLVLSSLGSCELATSLVVFTVNVLSETTMGTVEHTVVEVTLLEVVVVEGRGTVLVLSVAIGSNTVVVVAVIDDVVFLVGCTVEWAVLTTNKVSEIVVAVLSVINLESEIFEFPSSSFFTVPFSVIPLLGSAVLV